ncbi:lebercilin-like protein [Sorex araneus]|uniref:lebercilin-like protein n=1 Tax=Sorex araneus TaxID=42254 RepID=UPI0024339339|nr:lebercilin-like protein [Sorex araneus]
MLAQRRDAVTHRVLSARLHKIKELKNELADVTRKLEATIIENQFLKQVQFRHLKAIGKYESSQNNLPQVVAKHQNEVRSLRQLLKKSQGKERNVARKLRETDQELLKTKDALLGLQRLAEDKGLAEREELTQKLSALTAKLEANDKKIQRLEKQLRLNNKAFSQQLAAESRKSLAAQTTSKTLQMEMKRLQQKLKDKERELEIRNIYTNRILKNLCESQDDLKVSSTKATQVDRTSYPLVMVKHQETQKSCDVPAVTAKVQRPARPGDWPSAWAQIGGDAASGALGSRNPPTQEASVTHGGRWRCFSPLQARKKAGSSGPKEKAAAGPGPGPPSASKHPSQEDPRRRHHDPAGGQELAGAEVPTPLDSAGTLGDRAEPEKGAARTPEQEVPAKCLQAAGPEREREWAPERERERDRAPEREREWAPERERERDRAPERELALARERPAEAPPEPSATHGSRPPLRPRKHYSFTEVIENLHQGLPVAGAGARAGRPRARPDAAACAYEPSLGRARRALPDRKNSLMEELFGAPGQPPPGQPSANNAFGDSRVTVPNSVPSPSPSPSPPGGKRKIII